MNFFFGIQNNLFSSKLEIPIFKNDGTFLEETILYKLKIQDLEWKIEIFDKSKKNNFFFHVNSSDVNNNDIFFIGRHENLKKFKSNKLIVLNEFTSLVPHGYHYRSNLRVNINKGGFSSYQSDYPYKMTPVKGSVVTSLASVTNFNADKNYIFFKNIYELPIQENFKIYIVDLKEKKIKTFFEAKTNYSNFFEIKKEYILPEMFLVSKNYVGIPIYISEKNGQISMEHTNPPTSNILNSDRIDIVKKFKRELNEIIN